MNPISTIFPFSFFFPLPLLACSLSFSYSFFLSFLSLLGLPTLFLSLPLLAFSFLSLPFSLSFLSPKTLKLEFFLPPDFSFLLEPDLLKLLQHRAFALLLSFLGTLKLM